MNKVCNHSKANKEEQESSTKINHYIEIKQTTQQNSTTKSTITKQAIFYITTRRHNRICLTSLCNQILQII